MQSSESNFFRLPRLALRIFGIWPMNQKQLPLRFYINFISLFFAAIFGITHGFVNLDQLFLALESFCGSIFEFVSWCKVLFIWYHRKNFENLLMELFTYFSYGNSTSILFIIPSIKF